MVITTFVYLCIPSFWTQVRLLSWIQIKLFIGIGIVISIHWVFFYGSIKLGDSASITLTCMGSLGFFTSILEPIVMKQPFSYINIALGAVAIVGICLVFISLSMNTSQINHQSSEQVDTISTHKISEDFGFISPQLAVIAGLIGAFLASFFFVLNKKFIGNASPLVMSTIEMAAGAAFLTVLVPPLYKDHIIWYPSFDPYNLR